MKRVFKFSLLLILGTAICGISHSQSGSPRNPEQMAFESIDASDMVNLKTGDFVYNIPLIHIPSPEGGYSIPLSYLAGIKTEQESSWVGLGWSLNPGSINRTVSGFPDDFNGQLESINITNPSLTESGVNYNYILGYHSESTEKGSEGKISLWLLTVGYGNTAGASVGFRGVSAGYFKDQGFFTDAAGASYSSNNGVSYNIKGTMGAVASNLPGNLGLLSTVCSITQGLINDYNKNTYFNGWHFVQSGDFFVKKWEKWYHMDMNKYMYGTLYLEESGGTASGYIKVKNTGTSAYTAVKSFDHPNKKIHHDVNFDFSGDYRDNVHPVSLAYDNYNVMGEGISGLIQPYRLDIPSVAGLPSPGSQLYRFGLTSFKSDYNNGDKVNFIYKGVNMNYYTYHRGNPQTVSGIERKSLDADILYDIKYELNDNILYDQNLQIESNRSNNTLYNGKIAQGNHIEWYSNIDIINGNCGSLLDYKDGVFDRSSINEDDLIGGFAVTRSDGYTFHYALPVYEKSFESYGNDSEGFISVISRPHEYATTWLLTGITGPDYIDRGGDYDDVGNNQIDEFDWGYWVKFNYGRFSGEYKWQFPYLGFSNYSDKRSTGIKELYYLNTIETRTHVALFIKDTKKDGKSAFTTSSSPTNVTISKVIPSLRLEDIILLKKGDYNTLLNMGFDMKTSDNSDQMLGNTIYTTYDNVIDKKDFGDWNNPNSILSFLKDKQQKRIHFNYSYNLCKKFFNSFDISQLKTSIQQGQYGASGCYLNNGEELSGKLTLESIDILCKDDLKIMPGYDFDYGDYNNSELNPDYNGDYDDWGVYKSNSNYSSSEEKADQWCLRRIKYPIGGEINIQYERDDYSSISGHALFSDQFINYYELDYHLGGTGYEYFYYEDSQSRLWFPFKERELFKIAVLCGNGDYVEREVVILNHQKSSITLFGANYSHKLEFMPESGPLKQDPTIITKGGVHEVFLLIPEKKLGGDVRVKQLNLTDENNNTYNTTYSYSKNGTETSVTSGVCTVEPESCQSLTSPFYQQGINSFSDFPSASIIYGQVTVYNGDINNYIDKTVYSYETPKTDIISINNECFDSGGDGEHDFMGYNIDVDVNVSKVGRLNSVETYNSDDMILGKSIYNYYDDGTGDYNNIGIYTEGTLLSEVRSKVVNGMSHLHFRLFRTTKNYVPCILESVETIDGNGDKTISRNIEFDLITGMSTITEVESKGKKYRTESLQAYKVYDEMGSKILNINHKNMLDNSAATLSKIYNSQQGWQVIGAGVKTYTSTHRYRNAHISIYSPDYILSDGVWRPSKSFTWNGDYNEDGTFNNFSTYDTADKLIANWTDFSGDGINGWQKAEEVTRYNRFSKILESMNISGIFNSIKYSDMNNDNVLSTCSNSNYRSFVHCGFEEVHYATNNRELYGDFIFEDNACIGDSKQSSLNNSHTGNYCCEIIQGGISPKIRLSNNDDINHPSGKILPGKYLSSVWVHKNSSVSLKVVFCNTYSSYDKSVDISTSDIEVGNWKLLVLNFEVPAMIESEYLNIYVENGDGIAYIDDFRVQPANAQLTSYIYDENDRITYILDNNNFGTKYIYNNRGQLREVQRETVKYGWQTVSKHYLHYAKQDWASDPLK